MQGYWLLVIGCWLLVIGCWLLVIGYWLLVVGCWLLVVGMPVRNAVEVGQRWPDVIDTVRGYLQRNVFAPPPTQESFVSGLLSCT